MTTLPTVTVELGSSLPTVPIASTTWVDISADFRSAQIQRGRQSELTRVGAGRATLVLSNADRDYDPTHAGGPHYAYLKPRRRIRVRATWNAVTYDVFSGYVDKITQRYAPPNEAVAVIEASDALSVLAQAGLPGSVWEAEVRSDGPRAWWRLGEPAGATTVFDAAGTAHGTYGGAPTFGQQGLIVRDADTAVTFPTGDDYVMLHPDAFAGLTAWSLEFWVRVAEPPVNAGLFRMFVDNGFPGDLSLSAQNPFTGVPPYDRLYVSFLNPTVGAEANAYSSVPVFDGVTHHVVVTGAVGQTPRIYVDGVDRTAGTLDTIAVALRSGSQPHFNRYGATAANPTVDEVALYGSVLGATRVAAHNAAGRTPWRGDTSGTRIGRILDLIGWPAADRVIDAGQATLQSASLGGAALDHAHKVEETEAGLLFADKAGRVRFRSRHGGFNPTTQAIFGDGAGELGYTSMEPYQSVHLIVNEARVSRADGVVQRASDQASADEYQLRTHTLEGLLHQSDAESLDRAWYVVNTSKDPQSRIDRLGIDPHQADPSAYFTQILARELGDQIQVRRRPQNVGSAMTLVARIEGMELDIAPGRWGASWNISPERAGDFLQLDDTDGPGLGGVRLAY